MAKDISELTDFLSGLMTDARAVLLETAQQIRGRMAEEGKPITYPVQWDSEKQRRAFFATNGFGGGIPHVRTGAYQRGWTAEPRSFGAVLFNHTRGAGAIGGTPSGWQSRIHRNRWNYLLQILSEELTKIPDAIRNKFSVRSRE